jgi:hypothetical protein
MCGVDDPAAMWEIILYAEPAALAEFPPDLFFDRDVIWHEQHFGRPGQIATASLVVDESTVHAITHVSDLVQRISRRREYKSRIENRFKGWSHMLLNAVLHFALDRRAKRVRLASSTLAGRHTDRKRQVDLTIFERIYDRTVTSVLAPSRDGEWWVVDLPKARGRIVTPDRRTSWVEPTKAVCICHDIERGLGHRDVAPSFAREADRTSRRDLVAMRSIEADLGVRATYCVVGLLMAEVRADLETDGHCVAFHSFDHRADRDDQLVRCRKLDYRIKGYRPPRSALTPDLTDRNLLFHNFEWLASSWRSLGSRVPELRGGLVRLPITVDDFSLHQRRLSYEEWERDALQLVADNDFAVISLHDCYATHWLHGYRDFLARVTELRKLSTLDEVAAEVTLAGSA